MPTIIFALALAVLGMSSPPPQDVTGTWDIAAVFSIKGGPGDGQSTNMRAVLDLVQQGKSLSGTFIPYEADGTTAQPAMKLLDARISGAKVTFSVKQDKGSSLKFALVLIEGQLRGDAVATKPISGGGTLTIKMTATRRSEDHPRLSVQPAEMS